MADHQGASADMKLLVIVPHPDDEINLAAQFILSLKGKVETYIVYTTNGDCDQDIDNKRIQEAIDALALIGVDEDHVILMGYTCNWKSGQHIFDSNGVVSSATGKSITNSLPTHPEYCYSKYGIHHEFTYDNYKKDLRAILEDIYPEVVICVDFDRNIDHRAASITFDKLMGEILKENNAYRPLVLKKFAYNGVWQGPRDYYSNPPSPTINRQEFYYSGGFHELESPAYTWGGTYRTAGRSWNDNTCITR